MTTLDLEETRAAWDAIAPGYDRYVTPTEAPLANALQSAAIVLANVGGSPDRAIASTSLRCSSIASSTRSVWAAR